MSKRRPSSKGQVSRGRTAKARRIRSAASDTFVLRPFEGLPDEADWVALRELVPAATAPLQLQGELAASYPDRTVTLATVLPMAWPALTRADGQVLLGLQRSTQSSDASRDLAAALLAALAARTPGPVSVPAVAGPGPRLQDVLAETGLEITVRAGFDFWLGDGADGADGVDESVVRASMERANASVFPTARLGAVRAAYWCRFPELAHLRWVLPDDEDAALAALSRVSADGGLTLGERTRFAGMFRTRGLLVPVWDLPREPDADAWEGPLSAFAQRYAEALAVEDALDAGQRRARQGLLGRQLTLR